MKKLFNLLDQKQGKLLSFGILLWIGCVNLNGQVPLIENEKCFGGNEWDIPYSLQLTNDAGYIVFGGTESNDGDVHGNHGERDLWLLRLDAEWDTLWTKCLGGSEIEWAGKILQTQDNGYIICGNTYSFDGDVHGNHGESDAWVVKLNAGGDTLWTKCLGGSLEEDALSIAEIPGEGYILAGLTNSADGDVHGEHGGFDIWVLKLSLTGDTLWTKCYGGTGYDVAQDMAVANDGSFVIAGSSNSGDGDVHGNHGNVDFFVMKINTSGDTLWTRCFGGSDSDGVYGIDQTSDNGFILTGYTLSDDGDVHGNHGDYDAWVIKLDAEGNMLWGKCFGGSASDYTTSALQLTDENYLLAGYAESTDGDVHGNHGEKDCWLIKLDPNGDTMWTQCYGGSLTDEIQDILQMADGFVFAGFSNSNDGDVLSERFESHDYWMVRLYVHEEPDYIPEQTDLNKIYPNPTRGKLFVECQEMKELRIFDPMGRLVLLSLDKEMDLTTYPAGFYVVRLLDTNGSVTTCKLVVTE